MEDEPTTSPPTPTPPSSQENAGAEDTTPQDAPADPSDGPDEDADEDEDQDQDEEGSGVEDPPSRGEAPPSGSDELPRTTTTGDDAEDLRRAGDGAESGAPGDDLEDSGQRHD